MSSVTLKRTLQLVCVTLFICDSRELPVDSMETAAVTEATDIMDDVQPFNGMKDDTLVPRNSSVERWNHSRMLQKSTTLGYDEWWFLTTQRNLISYKDFPGRSGVATWKEINPGESRDSRKMKNPETTAEAFNSAWRFSSNYVWLIIVFYFSFERFFLNP